MAGAAATLLPAMVAGARGGIIAIACAAPRRRSCSIELSSPAIIRRAGLNFNGSLRPAAGAVTGTNGIAGLKTAMELEGLQGGLPRRPLLPCKSEQQEDLAQVFRRMNSELAELS